uniref:Putative secreted protein n=1 Tax=Anopheles darlingi TaxID=43151 RepID=A0A2M4DCA7_ANODA
MHSNIHFLLLLYSLFLLLLMLTMAPICYPTPHKTLEWRNSIGLLSRAVDYHLSHGANMAMAGSRAAVA